MAALSEVRAGIRKLVIKEYRTTEEFYRTQDGEDVSTLSLLGRAMKEVNPHRKVGEVLVDWKKPILRTPKIVRFTWPDGTVDVVRK